ncbi:MAG: 6-phosphogluconolactonase [Acidobacteriota bacterium]
MSSSVMIFKDSDEVAAQAADLIVQVTQKSIQARGRAMLAMAGGSTPKATYGLLAESPRCNRIDWAQTYLFFGDERFVLPDDPSSNFAMVQKTLLEPLAAPVEHVFPIPTQFSDAADAAAAYSVTLAKVFGVDDGADPPRFDLVLLGLGDDGHTASLFPGAASLDITDLWVVASPPGTLPPPVERITLTFPVLNAAREILFLVAGENKAEAVYDVLEGKPSRQERPAAYVRPANGNLTWLLDEAAASRLTAQS